MFYVRLKKICEAKNTTVTRMLQDLNLSTSSTGSWKKGMLPKGEILKLISEYLNVSIDYLLFGYEKFAPIDYSDAILLENYHKLSELDKGRVLERIDILLSR